MQPSLQCLRSCDIPAKNNNFYYSEFLTGDHVSRKKKVLLLLLKPAVQDQVGKRKLFINCLRNPTSTCATESWKKHNSWKQPTVDCTLEPIQRSGVKHCIGKVIPDSNFSRQERPSKLGRSTPWYFTLRWMSCGRSLSMSNSSRSRWKLDQQWWEFELTSYNILSPATWRR